MQYALRRSAVAIAGSLLIAGGAQAADPIPIVALPSVEPAPRCDTAGYVDAYVGAGYGRVFNPGNPDFGALWGDVAFGGAGRAAIQCSPRFSLQLDAWGDRWEGYWAYYDDAGPYSEPEYFERTTLGIGTHLTLHTGRFLVGPLASIGSVANVGTFANVGIEAAFNTERMRFEGQIGFTPALLGPAAAVDARDFYAQIGAAFYVRPNFSISANVGGDLYSDTSTWYRRTLSWGAKIEFSPRSMPVAFYVGYEGWHWGEGFDTAYDYNYAWEHAVRVGIRFMVGADTLRELDEAVGLIDENAIYGQAFGPTYLDVLNN